MRAISYPKSSSRKAERRDDYPDPSSGRMTAEGMRLHPRFGVQSVQSGCFFDCQRPPLVAGPTSTGDHNPELGGAEQVAARYS